MNTTVDVNEKPKLQEYATEAQIEFFDRLRSGDDPVHEEARTELVELANELLTILAFPIDAAAAAYVARTLLDDSKLELWTGDRIDRPLTEDGKLDDNVLTDSEVRLHVVGDTGLMEFYRVLDVMARLLILAGRGARVVVPGPNPVPALTWPEIADAGVRAAVAALVEKKGEPPALSTNNVVRAAEKNPTQQAEMLRKAAAQ